MKKIIFALITVMMLISVAFACNLENCPCQPDSFVQTTCAQIVAANVNMSGAEASQIIGISTNKMTNCSTAKFTLMTVIVRNADFIKSNYTESQLALLIDWATRCYCGCVVGNVTTLNLNDTSAPAPTHNHYGGNHENGGTCKSCGKVYQAHNVKYEYANNSEHTKKCSYGCFSNNELHKKGDLLGVENGMGKYYCALCGHTFYWYISNSSNANCVCGKCGTGQCNCCGDCE